MSDNKLLVYFVLYYIFGCDMGGYRGQCTDITSLNLRRDKVLRRASPVTNTLMFLVVTSLILTKIYL